MKKYLCYLMIIMVFLMPLYKVKATTLNDLYAEVNSLEKSYNASKQRANMSKAELANVQASITNTENEVKQVQNEIVKAENDIKANEKKIMEKKDETNQMLLYLQLSSGQGDSMLEYVFEADNYTDFIYRYNVVSQMSNYNNKLLDELNNLIKQITVQKANLAKKQESLNVKRKELQEKYVLVQAQAKKENDAGLSISEQISEKKKLISHYEKIGCGKSQEVTACVAAYSRRQSAASSYSGGGGGGTATTLGNGWVYPVSSFVVSSLYGERRGSVRHYAVDLATPEGSSVFAVRDGVVLSSRVPSNGCGGMIIQVSHGNYTSLYMHLIDSYVSVGSYVKAGQVIGISGGGPREVAKWGDGCTGGAHLHFAMANGGGMIGYSSEAGATFNPGRIFPRMG
ncbi:MAG: peptidoglycan DD-metalloendopeptidase family protein [Bacilli bacterium]|nr:peptidoglycan DD-metalloendopeptidase family protein [Bacilli bacterium]